jgi:hypothetical protein
MSLNLISDDEVVISDESRYVKMGVRREVGEIYAEIMKDDSLIKYFYRRFEENTKQMNELFAHIDDMTPKERMMKLSTLPPIPTFLCDTKCIFLKINKNQFNIIGKLSRILNTEMSNLTRILFYVSIPQYLYSQFPYLMDHYRFTELIINFYIEKTNGERSLRYMKILTNIYNIFS